MYLMHLLANLIRPRNRMSSLHLRKILWGTLLSGSSACCYLKAAVHFPCLISGRFELAGY